MTLIRPDLDTLPAYVPGKTIPGAIKLASNEVALPPTPKVLAAMAEAAATGNRYPDLAVTGLTARLAEARGVAPERTAVGWAGAGRFRADVGLPGWSVTGRAGLRRIRVEVHQPAERTLALEYTDPDGSRATCRNSERADAHVLLERWWFGGWRTEAEWRLDGTAHAEVGTR